jgi:DNA-binding SARP family transcriptional activator/DNA-binding beta-propeller fold protein YncE
VEFRILGPLEVLEDGNPVALGTLKERLVLGVLLLHANEFVSRERLIDDLWGEAPPPTARKAVNVYISKIRRTLTRDGHDPIATADGCYRLAVASGLLDVERMRALVAQAREGMAGGHSEAASQLLQKALAFWRGPTLAGLSLESVGRDEIAQLDELRLAALMDRIDCDLALGHQEQVLGELNILIREHPLRERLRAQQMLALYRADRQAEALKAYAEARRTLVDDLGIEPSEALQRLQQAILRHDASLEKPTGTATVNGLEPGAPALPTPAAPPLVKAEATRRGQVRSRRRQLVLAAAVLLVGSAAAAAILSASASATPRILPNSLVQLNPRTGKPILVKQVGSYPGEIAITPTAIWTPNDGSADVSRYDLRTHTVATRSVGYGRPYSIVFDRVGDAFISNATTNDAPQKQSVVVKLDAGPGGTSAGPIFNSRFVPIHIPLPYAGEEAIGGGDLWVIVGEHGPIPGDNRVAVVDLRTDHVSVLHLHESATTIAFAYGAAWIGTYGASIPPYRDDSELEVFRPGETKPTRIVLQPHGANWGPTWIGASGGVLWALTCSPRCGLSNPVITLMKIDPQTLKILSRRDLSASPPGSVTVGAGGIWTANNGSNRNNNTISELDPRTLKTVRTFPFAGQTREICEIRATRTALWVSVGGRYCGTIGS